MLRQTGSGTLGGCPLPSSSHAMMRHLGSSWAPQAVRVCTSCGMYLGWGSRDLTCVGHSILSTLCSLPPLPLPFLPPSCGLTLTPTEKSHCLLNPLHCPCEIAPVPWGGDWCFVLEGVMHSGPSLGSPHALCFVPRGMAATPATSSLCPLQRFRTDTSVFMALSPGHACWSPIQHGGGVCQTDSLASGPGSVTCSLCSCAGLACRSQFPPVHGRDASLTCHVRMQCS